MVFLRTGIPDKFTVLKFRCLQCGAESATLVNGKCGICSSQKIWVPPEILKSRKKKNVRKNS